MQNTYTPSKQMKGSKNIIVVPTKTDSRSSETQKRLYAAPNGAAFKFLTKSSVSFGPDQGNFIPPPSGRTSPTSVLDQQMNMDHNFDLEEWVLSILA